MRFTLRPGADVDVPDGATLGQCRPGLAALTGTAELADAVLTVDGVVLPDDHVAGAEPWVHGSVVHLGPSHADPVAAAVAVPWHVAVVAGPDAGLVAVPDATGAVHVARGGHGADGTAGHGTAGHGTAGDGTARDDDGLRWWGGHAPPGHLVLTDPQVSRTPLTFRRHRPSGRRLRVSLAAAPGRRLPPEARGSAPLSGRRRRLVDLDVPVRVGRTVLVVRGPHGAGATATPGAARPSAHPDGRRVRRWRRAGGRGTAVPADAGVTDADVDRPGPASGRDSQRTDAGAGRSAAWWAPALTSAGLALALRNPVYLLLGAAGPLGVVVAALTRRRPRRTAPGPVCSPVLGPDAAAIALASARRPAQAARVTAAPGLPRAVGGGPDDDVPLAWWPLATEGLAVVGPAHVRRAVARALVAGAFVSPHGAVTLHLVGAATDGPWTWCRWSAVPGLPSADDARHPDGHPRRLVVCEDVLRRRTALHRWWMTARTSTDAVLLLDDSAARLPAWCRWTVHVTADGSATLHGPGGGREVRPPEGSAAWADQVLRRVVTRSTGDAAAAGPGPGLPGGPGTTLPDVVALADLVAPDGGDVSAAVARTWQQRVAAPAAGLRAPIGLGPGPGGVALVEVDLLRDGPHALVAGTTGSGKSELLQTLVLGMALRHPPSALTFLLVDYKGGTSLGPCPDLPHVVGHVTDLDAAEAARALRGLTAEVRRREALLARAGVPDLGALGGAGSDGPAPPRLVVVVDEFRTLSEELPDFVPGLVRLAAQGRSLGIHVVLATQRPAGAVTAQMRANLGLRICLRVADAADSTDVVEVPHAADLPSTRPGLALVRRGAAHAEVVQTAWAAAPPGGWTPPPRDGAPVAVRWAGTADASRRVTGASAHTRVLVEACRSAAERRGDATPPHVWLPALPTDVTWSELPVPATGLALGLTDLPDHQARGLLTWPGGVLVVAGGPGSGRTTALRTACLAALDRGWAVHVVDAPGSAGVAAGAVGHHCLGTVVGPDDPGRLARLLLRLSTVDQAPGLLVVDDVAATLAALDQLPRGTASGLLDTVLRDGPRRGLSVALSGAPADVPRLLGQATHRLVLPVTDPAEDVLLGVPRELGGTRRAPGRAVAVGPTGTALCQVAAPPPGADPVASCRPRREGPAPLALRPVPAHVARVRPTAVDRAGPRLDGPWEVPLGLGGDDAGPVVADVRRGLLVIGPAASGRSTALATLHAGLDAAGYRVVLVARSGPLVAASSSDRDTRGRQDPGRLLREARGRADVVLVDDLDLVLRAAPEAEELLLGWLAGAEEDDPSVPRVVATARTDRAASTYRGPLAQLRADAPALVLSPATPGSAEVAGQDLALAVDPLRPTHPGRGVLVTDGHLTVVQVADGISQGPGEEAAGPRRADGSQRRRVRTDRPATRGT